MAVLLVSAIHTAVSGRGRYAVEGLTGNPGLARLIEQGMSRAEGVREVRANPLTGRVLVRFNGGNTHSAVAEALSELVGGNNGGHHPTPRVPPLRPVNPFPHVARFRLAVFSSAYRMRDRLCSPLSPGVPAAGPSAPPSSFQPQEEDKWHVLAADTVVDAMGSDPVRGLEPAAVSEVLKRFGPNLLPESKKRSGLSIFAGQFTSLPVGLLGVTAVISVATGGVLEAAAIMGVAVLNGVIGYYTEDQAEKTIHNLAGPVKPMSVVLRGGEEQEIPAENLVVGDLLVLRPGSYVGADARIIQASHMSVDESALTGESMPVDKTAATLILENTPLADRVNMVHMGTLVTGGEGRAIVVATGRYTQIGQLQLLLAETRPPPTPIEKSLTQIGNKLAIGAGVVSVAVFGIGFLRGYGLVELITMSVSLAAAAVPEGLPTAATVTFAIGMEEMRRHRVLIRKLQAVETLGSVCAVCFDKTGTITENRMSVTRVHAGDRNIRMEDGRFFENGDQVDMTRRPGLWQLATVCALCNESRSIPDRTTGERRLVGSSTENALLQMAIDAGIDEDDLRGGHELEKVCYRSESRLYMTMLFTRRDGSRYLGVKGSPMEVLDLCEWQWKHGRRIRLDDDDRRRIETENARMAGEALRVLGIASADGGATITCEEVSGPPWLGLVGMADPVREGVNDIIEVFHSAGIDTVMITGDQSPTAYAVARQLNLSGKGHLRILDSAELAGLDHEKLAALSKKASVYSRVSPAHKLQIVHALQSDGTVVAMTGDGINDGPALKAADIGIAMGRSGTDVAREVADVVLEDDNLETLILAVKGGRTIYNNIRKSVHFFLSTNLSEIMLLSSGVALGLGTLLNPMQLLWINLISDIFPGLALSMEAAEPDVLDRPPRKPNSPLFDGADFKRMGRESLVLTAGALAAYGYGAARYGAGPAAGGLAFQTLTVSQLLHAVSCRSENRLLFEKVRPPKNRYVTWAVAGSLALQGLTMVAPGPRKFFSVAAPRLADLAVVGATVVGTFVANQLLKPGSAHGDGKQTSTQGKEAPAAALPTH